LIAELHLTLSPALCQFGIGCQPSSPSSSRDFRCDGSFSKDKECTLKYSDTSLTVAMREFELATKAMSNFLFMATADSSLWGGLH
jgi:hypothetical protein